MRTFGCLVVVLLLARPAFAQKVEADAAFQRGRALMDKGEIAQACVEFEASMRFEAQMGTLYNLALCHEQLGKVATAYSEFKELSVNDPNKARGKDAAKHAKALEPKLTKMHLVVKEPVEGLTITRDGLDVTVFVNQEVPVDPKEYTFIANAPKHDAQTITLALDKPGTIDVVIPPLTATGDIQQPPPQKPIEADAYALSLIERPIALPKNVIEATAASVYQTSKNFMTDPLDVFAGGRMGLGSLEVDLATAVHAIYPVDDNRADAWAFIRAGGRYSLSPMFTAGFDYTWYQPSGAPTTGSDLEVRIARKYRLGPKVAVEGDGGILFSQRKNRGGGEAQEFAAIGRGEVQLGIIDRLTFEADTDIAVNLGGELYTDTLFLTLRGAVVLAIDRHTDAFLAAAFIVAPDSDLKTFTAGITRRIP